METASSSFQTPASVSSRPEFFFLIKFKISASQSLTYCHSLEETVNGERHDHQETSQRGEDLLLASSPLDVSLGGGLHAAGVRVGAVGLVGRVRDVVDVAFGGGAPLSLTPGLANLHHVARVLNSILNRKYHF